MTIAARVAAYVRDLHDAPPPLTAGQRSDADYAECVAAPHLSAADDAPSGSERAAVRNAIRRAATDWVRARGKVRASGRAA